MRTHLYPVITLLLALVGNPSVLQPAVAEAAPRMVVFEGFYRPT